jgi:hypothetical protein
MHPVAMAESAAPDGDGRRTDEEGANDTGEWDTGERCRERGAHDAVGDGGKCTAWHSKRAVGEVGRRSERPCCFRVGRISI